MSKLRYDVSMERFRHYNKKLVQLGLQCGLALKSMEDSIRAELLDQLSQYTNKNTALANLLSWHEKTIRTLRQKYSNLDEIYNQNRMWRVAMLLHEKTKKKDSWITLSNLYDAYLERFDDDASFTEAALNDVLEALILQGTSVAHRMSYQTYYRVSQDSQPVRMIAEDDTDAVEMIAAIQDRFDEVAEEAIHDDDMLQRTKVREWTFRTPPGMTLGEFKTKLYGFVEGLLDEAEEKSEGSEGEESTLIMMLHASAKGSE